MFRESDAFRDRWLREPRTTTNLKSYRFIEYRDGIGSDWKVAFSCLLPSAWYRQEGGRRENTTLQSLRFPPRYNLKWQTSLPMYNTLYHCDDETAKSDRLGCGMDGSWQGYRAWFPVGNEKERKESRPDGMLSSPSVHSYKISRVCISIESHIPGDTILILEQNKTSCLVKRGPVTALNVRCSLAWR